VRWALAGSASQVVAANFRATGSPMKEEDAKRLAAVAAQLQAKFKNQIPAGGETIPNTVAPFRAKMMEAMVPVIGAVAQYAFGRAEHDLLAEVAERLVKTSDQVTRALAASGSTPRAMAAFGLEQSACGWTDLHRKPLRRSRQASFTWNRRKGLPISPSTAMPFR
jgi:hypothetical protein